MTTEHDFDTSLTLQDKVRLLLNEKHSKYVPITVDDLAAQLSVPRPYDVYQTLSRLKRLGEIDFEKNDRNRIVGIHVNKLEPSGRTYQRVAERAKATIARTPIEDTGLSMTALSEYAKQKIAILDMQEKAKEAGLNPEDTVKFEPNPYAEEGLRLLQLLGDMGKQLSEKKEELQMTQFDLEAAKRDVEFLKRQNRDDTMRDLVGSAAH